MDNGKWYIVESKNYVVGEGHQSATQKKCYAEWLLNDLLKKRELGIIDYDPVMREATPEESALFEFDFEIDDFGDKEVSDEEVAVMEENISDWWDVEEDLPF